MPCRYRHRDMCGRAILGAGCTNEIDRGRVCVGCAFHALRKMVGCEYLGVDVLYIHEDRNGAPSTPSGVKAVCLKDLQHFRPIALDGSDCFRCQRMDGLKEDISPERL